jgi:homopolymeric O-antigen transport system permease protein
MLKNLSELWRYRELLLLLIQRDLKVRYKNSILGFGWSFINPLIQVLPITIVMKFLMSADAPNYHAYVFCATLPWIFFSTAVMDSCSSLVSYYGLVRKTYFPREIIPLATVAANFIHFMMALPVFLVYMAANSCLWWALHGKLDWPLQATAFLIPIPILGLTLLVTGVSMFVSVWTLYFEDVRFLTDSALKIVYWVVPVIYFADIFLRRDTWGHGSLLYTLYMLNPLSCLISAFRKLTLVPTIMPGPPDQTFPTYPMTGQDWLLLGIALLTSLAFGLVGYQYFCSRKWKLAER